MANTESPELANEHPAANAPTPIGKVRWGICGLLFFATTTNYIDRAILSVLFPILKHSPADGGLGWTKDDYGTINAVFSLAYAVGLFFAGGFIKRIGIRWGLFWAVVAWTIASRAHGLVALINPNSTIDLPTLHVPGLGWTLGGPMLMTVFAFCVCRVFLAISEAANFPAAIKAVAEWFPKKERALSTGIFNCGANIGAMIAPFVVPQIALKWGWSVAFYITGVLAVVWLVLWYLYYQSPEKHPTVTPEELAYIRSDTDEQKEPERKLPWSMFFFKRQTIAFSIGKFLTDPIWWFYLFWVPDFLNTRFGVKVTDAGLPLVFIYSMTTFGSIGGGWLSSAMIKRGFTVNFARKIAMLICALAVVPVFCSALIPVAWGPAGLWLAICLIALAASAHQGFSANIFTLVSDTVPKQGIPAVTGIGGMAGGIGSMFLSKIVGKILDLTGSYLYPLFIAASAYVIAIIVIHLILPRLERMELPPIDTTSTTA